MNKCSPGCGKVLSDGILKFERVVPGVPEPIYQHAGDSGFDLCSADSMDVILAPGERRLFRTGLRFQIPEGYELQVRPRSGLAVEYGLTVLNAPGTIDSGYRGEVRVPLINLGKEPVCIWFGMRIAQAVLAPVAKAELVEGFVANDTERGDGGFGSTGH